MKKRTAFVHTSCGCFVVLNSLSEGSMPCLQGWTTSWVLGLEADGRNPAPPEKHWNSEPPEKTNKRSGFPWFQGGANWISSIHRSGPQRRRPASTTRSLRETKELLAREKIRALECVRPLKLTGRLFMAGFRLRVPGFHGREQPCRFGLPDLLEGLL